MSSLGSAGGRRMAVRVLAALLYAVFDFATIFPMAAGGYVVKREVQLDVFPGVDTLPDPVIEGLLAEVAREIRKYL